MFKKYEFYVNLDGKLFELKTDGNVSYFEHHVNDGDHFSKDEIEVIF